MPNSKDLKKPIRVVVADDNKAIREKVVQLLRPDFDVVGTACDGSSACEAVFLLSPEAVVLDISMPKMSGIDVANEIRIKGSATKVVFLTVHDDPDFVRVALKAGATGYVIKSQMATDLTVALNAARDGDLFISPSCALA